MREPPWLLPRTCPGPCCSWSTTSTPRDCSCHAVAPPMTPPPTTATRIVTNFVGFAGRGPAYSTKVVLSELFVGEAEGDRLLGIQPPVAARPLALDLRLGERRALGEDGEQPLLQALGQLDALLDLADLA